MDTGTRAALPAVSPDDLRDLLEDSRDGLVASGDVHAYLRVLLFLHDLRDQVTDPEWRAEVDRVLVQGNTRPTLRLLLAAVGRGDAAPADVLFALRGMAELEPTWLAEALAETPDEEGRVAVADAVVDLLWPDEEAVEALLALCNPGSLRAVVTALARVSPDGSMALLRKVFGDADAETQVRILTTALTHRSRDGLPRLAKRALASSSDEVLALGLRAAALTRNPKLLKPIEAMIQPGPLMEMNRETAVEALRTYAEMPAGDKLGWLIKQARPPRMALMDSAGEELRCRYALALGLVIDERARKALIALQGKGSAAFQEAVKGALPQPPGVPIVNADEPHPSEEAAFQADGSLAEPTAALDPIHRLREEREAAELQELREHGRGAIHTLHQLLRNFQLYEPDNAVFERPLREFDQSLRSLNARLGEVRLLLVEGQPYLGDLRLRSDSTSAATISFLESWMDDLGIGGWVFTPAPDSEALRTFFGQLAAFRGRQQDGLQKLRAWVEEREFDWASPLPPHRFREAGEEKLDDGVGGAKIPEIFRQGLDATQQYFGMLSRAGGARH